MNEFSQEQELEDLRRELNRALREAAANKRKTDELVGAVYQAALTAAKSMPKVAVSAPKLPKSRHSEVAVLHLTDWQAGKKTVSYGLATLEERIRQSWQKTVEITAIQRAGRPVNDIVILFGGDMVEGVDIFPGQAYQIEAHLYQQLFDVSRIMQQVVVDAAATFNNVRIVCEYGNHGRLGRRGELPSGDNIDLIAYTIARDATAHLKNVSWQMSTDWHQVFEIGNYRGLLVHGDEIKSFGGNTPAFGILRKVNAWAAGVIEPFTDAYMGHWHTPMSLSLANGGRIFVTGSPESHNEYAREFVAATSKPSQRLHFVDPRKGRVTGEFVLWLD